MPVMQVVANGLAGAGVYLLLGVGFALIYNVFRFFHFAHGIIFTAGAYFTYVFSELLGWPLSWSAPVGVALSALLGCSIEVVVYTPLRRRAASPLIMLLASLAVYTIIQNAISLLFGDATKIIRTAPVEAGVSLLGARVTGIQLLIITGAVLSGVTLWLVLTRCRFGRAIRATAADRELATIFGVSTTRVMLVTMFLGSALAGLAGILVAMDVDLSPTMGMEALMMAVVVVIVGGIGSVPGAALAAVLLGVSLQTAVWFLGSEWRETIAFLVLLVFLVVWPEGLLRTPSRSHR